MRSLVGCLVKIAHFHWRIKLIHNSRAEVRFSECGSPKRRGLIGWDAIDFHAATVYITRKKHGQPTTHPEGKTCPCCRHFSVTGAVAGSRTKGLEW
jgi:hypothetical protein